MATVGIATLDTRAVERAVQPGNSGVCERCDEVIRYQARLKARWVLCNVYEDSSRGRVWDRLEHFHPDCYAAAGAPHGEVVG